MQKNQIFPSKASKFDEEHRPFNINIVQQSIMKGGNGHLIGELKINEIVMTGSHNSGCAKDYGWIYAQQQVSITEQYVEHGARMFKLPIHWFDPTNSFCGCCGSRRSEGTEPYPAIAHEADGNTNCRLSVIQRGLKRVMRASIIFKEFADLATKYPEEVMIIKIEDYLFEFKSEANGAIHYSKQKVTDILDLMLKESGLRDRAFKIQDVNHMPKLSELRNGKNVILLMDTIVALEDNEQISKYMNYAYTFMAQIDWTQDPLRYDHKKKLADGRGTFDEQGNIIEPFFEVHIHPQASFSFLAYGYKYNNYRQVTDRYVYVYRKYDKKPNFLMGDYIDEGEIYQAVDEFNLNAARQKQYEMKQIQKQFAMSPNLGSSAFTKNQDLKLGSPDSHTMALTHHN